MDSTSTVSFADGPCLEPTRPSEAPGHCTQRLIASASAFPAAYVNDPSPTLLSRAKVAFIHYFINVGTHKASRVPLPLEASPSPFFNGLLVTSKRGTVPGASPF